VVQRQRFFLLVLLGAPEAFGFLLQPRDVALQILDPRGGFVELLLPRQHLRFHLPQLALECQRAAGSFPAAAHGVAVITDSIGQQEIEIRVLEREALRGSAVGGHKALREAPQALDVGTGEPVGETKHLAEPCGYARRLIHRRRGRAPVG
jgi:hypothetical protein